ncbi:MAG TPA: hypothetical protein VF592_12475 [Sphingomonas sp.]|jgi:hypothetical protein|uniref:hypothetical protein n=1 Tax=Sphingomonas sp. TaxID=28214 RepID=UPI002ED99443
MKDQEQGDERQVVDSHSIQQHRTSQEGLTFLFALVLGGPIWLFTFVPVCMFGIALSANWIEALPCYTVMIGPPAYLFVAMIYKFRKGGER